MDTAVLRKLHSNRSKNIFVGDYFQPWINTNLVLYWAFLAAALHMFMVMKEHFIQRNVAHWSVCNILLDTNEASWLRENKLHKAWILGQDFLVGSILCWFWRFVDDTQAYPLMEQKAILEKDCESLVNCWHFRSGCHQIKVSGFDDLGMTFIKQLYHK